MAARGGRERREGGDGAGAAEEERETEREKSCPNGHPSAHNSSGFHGQRIQKFPAGARSQLCFVSPSILTRQKQPSSPCIYFDSFYECVCCFFEFVLNSTSSCLAFCAFVRSFVRWCRQRENFKWLTFHFCACVCVEVRRVFHLTADRRRNSIATSSERESIHTENDGIQLIGRQNKLKSQRQTFDSKCRIWFQSISKL